MTTTINYALMAGKPNKTKGVSIAFEKFGKTELHSPNCILRT